VVERPRDHHKFFKPELWFSWWNLEIENWAGPLGGK
jgi:hypothetical protein